MPIGSIFVYDADGNRLIRHDTSGATLYLPGTELRLSAATGQVTGTRYYSWAGQPVAMRTPAGVSWLFNDRQGTSMIAISASDQTATERRQTPFGGPRGSVPGWPTEKGFVGGTVDSDGLVHLAAREYDPGIGRFVSADPVIDHGDPQQANGYAYANNSPITMSDPSGLRLCDDDNTCQGARHGPSDDPGATQADPTPTTPDPPANPAPAKHSSASGHWWDQAWNKAKSGFHTAVNWAEKHKAEIAGAAVGVAVGVGCGVAIGWTGVGAVACGVLAGAVASAVTYMIATPEKERSVGGLLLNVGIGAATGAVPLMGKAAAPVVGAAARAAGRAIAGSVARTAVQKAIGAVASGAGKSAARNLAEACAVIYETTAGVNPSALGASEPLMLDW
jgi:RHS repeat-associated protein